MGLKKEISDKIKDLLQKNPQGLSITDIVKAININRNTAGRYLENLLVSGQVELRHFGMAKIYRLSQRVPLSAVLSISAESVIQLDSFLRIIFVNESFCSLAGTDSTNLVGKNIEYTPVALVFDELFTGFIERIREGIAGYEWSGEINLNSKNTILFCRIAPTVFENGQKGVSVLLDDITQRKRAERALRESEAKLRSIAENSPDMILLLNLNLEIIFISQTYTIKSDQVCGKSVYDFIPREFHSEATACFEQVLKTGKTATYGTEYHFADATTLYFESTVGPVFQDDAVSALVINARDITDRKTSEEALRESEERYRQLVEISPDAVIIHQEGKITFLNPAALVMLGVMDSNEILGKNVLEIIHPDYRDAVRNNIEKDLSGNMTPPIELQLLRGDGSSVIVEGRGVKTTINGKPAIQVAIRDITERKRIETELRESEENYRTLVELENDVVCVVQEGIIKTCNPRLEYYWGGPLSEIIGRPFTDLIHPDTLPELINNYKRRMSGEFLPTRYETTLMHKDGSRSFVEMNASVIMYKGKPADLVVVRDINERKRAEAA